MDRTPVAAPLPAPVAPLRSPVPAQAAETSARAFPVEGLLPNPEPVRALRERLRLLTGVSQVYVSPVTALVYVTYEPAAITPAHMAEAIRRAGYRVADETRWFDWQHRLDSHA